MGKTVRQILSPELVHRMDKLLEGRHQSTERLKEERQRNAALLRPDGNVQTTNAEAQQGRRLHRTEFIRRIHRLNPNLWYEQSIRQPDRGGLYVADTTVPGFHKRMVCAFSHDWIPEFSIPLTKPSVIPSLDMAPVWDAIQEVDSKIPGWRAVLVKLLMEKHVTPSGIEKEFQITRGRSSQMWQQAVN